MTSSATTDGKRTVSPLMFIAMAFLGVCVLLGIFVGVLSTIEPELPRSSALQEVVMPDGTILALEAVTFGKSHNYSVERRSSGFSFFSGPTRHPLSHSTSEDVVMVWLTRRNARTGRAMDFDWWSHCVTVDSHGCEIRDRERYSHRDAIHSHGGSSGSGGSRPFHPLSSHGGHQEYDTIIARTALTPMRHDGDTFLLRVYDTSGKSVGEFTIKDPSPKNGKYPVWTPQELPVTASVEDMKITLTSLKNVLHEERGTRNNVPYVRLRPRLQYQFRIEENGEVSDRWNSSSMTLSDAIGNTVGTYDVSQLCTQESAWKLHVNFWRGSDEKNFDDTELWRVKGVAVPPKNKFKMLAQTTIIAGAQVRLVAVGGPGTSTYPGLNPGSSGGYSSSGSVGANHMFKVDRQNGRGKPNTTTVTCDLPHIVLGWSAAHPLQRVDRLQATDGQGRPVRIDGPHGGGYNGADGVYFLTRPHNSKVTDPIEKVSLVFAVQTAREAEFLVKPPEPQAPEPRYYQSLSPVQRLNNAKRTLERYEKDIELNPERTYLHFRFAREVVIAPEELRTPERLKKAVAAAERIVLESPQSPQYLTILGLAYLRSDDGRGLSRFRDNLINDLGDNNSILDLYGLALAQYEDGKAEQGRKTYEKALARHRSRIGYIQSSSEWHMLDTLRDEVQSKILGISPSELVVQADELVVAGELSKAAEVLDRLLTVSEDDHWPWFRSAALQLYTGNDEVWRRHCRRMLELFGKTTHPETAERVGKACLLSDCDEATLIQAQGLIEIALDRKPDSMWFALAKGLGHFRAGKDRAAIQSLNRALTLSGRTGAADVCIHAVMAMSQFRSGEVETARETLSLAEKVRAEKVPTLTDGNLRKDGWHDVLIAELLLQEAAGMMAP